MCLGWGLPRHWILEPLPGGSIERNYYGIRSPKLEQGWSFGTQFHNGSIYDPGSRFADPPPPQWYPPPPTLPKPNLYDFPHEGSKSDNCHEDRVPRRPIRVTVHIFQARLSREGAKAKAINRHEDPVPCDCRHFRKRIPI